MTETQRCIDELDELGLISRVYFDTATKYRHVTFFEGETIRLSPSDYHFLRSYEFYKRVFEEANIPEIRLRAAYEKAKAYREERIKEIMENQL